MPARQSPSEFVAAALAVAAACAPTWLLGHQISMTADAFLSLTLGAGTYAATIWYLTRLRNGS